MFSFFRFLYYGLRLLSGLLKPSPQNYSYDEEEYDDYDNNENENDNGEKLNDINEYTRIDMTFSPENLKKILSDTYLLFQTCWQNKNLQPLRLRMTDGLYSQMDMLLEPYRNNHQTNRLERMSVRRIDLLGWKHDGEYDMVLAELETRVIDYVTDDASGEMVGGSTEEFKYSTYECTLIRKRGVSVQASHSQMKICPKCGAHVRINSTTKCEYCGSVISNIVQDWALSNIKLLNQRRVDKNIQRKKRGEEH